MLNSIILVLIDSISIKFYNSKFTLICSILIHPCANIMKVPFIILYEWHFFIVFRQDKTVISSFPCFSFAAVYVGVCSAVAYRICSLNHSTIGFTVDGKNQSRPVRRFFHHLKPCLFGREFPLMFLRIEFSCILQQLSLDERCGLPFIESHKAAKVFDTEHFTEIKNLHPLLRLPSQAPSQYLSVFWYNCQIFSSPP